MVINQRLADRVKAGPGGSIELGGSCSAAPSILPPVTVRIAGVASFPFESGAQLTMASRFEVLDRLCERPAGEADLIMVASRPESGPDAAVEAIRKARPDLYAFSNDEVIERFERVGFSYFRQISAALAFVTLSFGIVLITVLLTVSVNQRLGEIAALRAIGFSRRRMAADVLWESALLVGIGGLVAIPLGLALSMWLDAILRSLPGVPATLALLRLRAAGALAPRRAPCGRGAGSRHLPDVARHAPADCRHAPAGVRLVSRTRAPIVEARGISRIFPMPAGAVVALRDVTIEVAEGEYVAIAGPSGCGKSTLLHVLGCVDTATSGELRLEGRDVGALSDAERSHIRLAKIGFVFQRFFLLPMLSALENVELPQAEAGVPRAVRLNRARMLLDYVGLGHRADHRPSQLSGGEMQRVAIARAMANRPRLILADEPTGELDQATGEAIAGLFDLLHSDGTAVVVVTHDQSIAERAQRVLRMRDGRIVDGALA